MPEDWRKGLSVISELGFEGVEISLREPDGSLRQSSTLMAAHDLTLLSIATGRSYYDDHIGLGDPQEQNRRACVQRMKALIEFASWLSSVCDHRGHSGARPHSLARPPCVKWESRFRLSLHESYCRFAQSKGVTLLLEPLNRYASSIVNSIDQALDLIESLGFSNFQILADTFHKEHRREVVDGGEPASRKRPLGLGPFYADSKTGWRPVGAIANPRASSLLLRTIAYRGYINVEVLPVVPSDQEAAQSKASKFYPIDRTRGGYRREQGKSRCRGLRRDRPEAGGWGSQTTGYGIGGCRPILPPPLPSGRWRKRGCPIHSTPLCLTEGPGIPAGGILPVSGIMDDFAPCAVDIILDATSAGVGTERNKEFVRQTGRQGHLPPKAGKGTAWLEVFFRSYANYRERRRRGLPETHFLQHHRKA